MTSFPAQPSTLDRNGRSVAEGTTVRVVSISDSVLARLDEVHKQHVKSMIGESFEVYEVDQGGGAWVQKWWHESESEATSHSLGLRPEEMEVVNEEAHRT